METVPTRRTRSLSAHSHKRADKHNGAMNGRTDHSCGKNLLRIPSPAFSGRSGILLIKAATKRTSARNVFVSLTRFLAHLGLRHIVATLAEEME